MITSITTNLMVESVDKTVGFYQEVLGFDLVASVPNEKGHLNFAILSKGSLMLMLQEKENFIAEYPILSTDSVRPSVSLYITVDNFNEIHEKIKSKTPILVDIHQTFYGTKEFAIADNNGYVLTITEQRT